MIRASQMTEEQKERIRDFRNFYTEDMIKTYSEIFDSYGKQTRSKEYYEAYRRIVAKTAKLMKEIKCDNPLLTSIAFEYLLWNGYLSENQELKYTLSNRKNNITIPGADIMRGKSVCLNNADMLTDIINTMGNEAHLVGCFIPKGLDMKELPKPAIERQIDLRVSLGYKIASKALSVLAIRKIGNHAVTMIKSNGRFYISDPTNLIFANITDFLKMEYLGTSTQIELKPWMSLIIGDTKKDVFSDIFLEAFILSDKPTLNQELVNGANNIVVDLCNQLQPVIRDFHTDINQDIITVSKKLQKEKTK